MFTLIFVRNLFYPNTWNSNKNNAIAMYQIDANYIRSKLL